MAICFLRCSITRGAPALVAIMVGWFLGALLSACIKFCIVFRIAAIWSNSLGQLFPLAANCALAMRVHMIAFLFTKPGNNGAVLFLRIVCVSVSVADCASIVFACNHLSHAAIKLVLQNRANSRHTNCATSPRRTC